MEHCPHCHVAATFLKSVSQIAYVDYYRCPECGHFWTTQKAEDKSSTLFPVGIAYQKFQS
jgi:hypothetical protein